MSSTTFELNNTVVRAGAGAGKTTGLVNKVVETFRQFRLENGKAPRIVLTTFTRKATQELKERLILRAVSEKDIELLQFVSDPTRLHVSTIHGLLNVFLKQVGHLAGLDSGFQIVDESQAQHLARVALREVLVNDEKSLNWLEVYGFSRVLEMCRRYQTFALEQGGLEPATLADIEAAVKKRITYWQNVFQMTLEELETAGDPSWQKFAQDLAQAVAGWSHSHPDVELLPSKPRRSKKQVDFEHLHEITEKLLRRFKDEMKDACWKSENWPAMIEAWKQFAQLARTFASKLNEIKNEHARFEMSDLELKAMEILRANPFLAGVFGEAWDFWMIDEFQDTSPLQASLLDFLIGEKPRYLVGDPQQSIYLFRGADVAVFHAAEKSIAEAGGEAIELRKNYRSEPGLLLWINDFMATFGGDFLKMEPREASLTPSACAVTMFRAPEVEVEAKGLVTRVQTLLASGARLDQICVISRTHRTLMEISRVLKAYGYPTHVHSSRGFNSRREVLDALALWKFLINPHDNLNLMLLLRSPWFFVGDSQIADWMEERPQSLWRLLEGISEVPESIARLRQSLHRVESEGLVRSFELALCANAFLDLSLKDDPAGRKESNLWKLIHKAQELEKKGGQSLLDLVDGDSDNPLDVTEGDAASAQEPNCINLMTIHGSKGLEFDHVLIPRMDESPMASITPPLFAEEGKYFFPTWSEEELRFVSSPLDFQANRRRREREAREYNRWLYVALTRAKKTLMLSWHGEGKDSWVESSAWFAKAEGTYATHDYNFEVVEKMPEPSPYREGPRLATAVRPLFHPNAAQIAEHISVSELVESARISDNLIQRWQAQTTGTQIHRALEALKYGGMSEENEAVSFVLENPMLREWIQSGFTEWGFKVRTPATVVEGQIDLWAKWQGKIYVVDYKSGSIRQQEAAFRQLSLYAWALRKFGHQEPIEMVVIYPLAKKIESREFKEDLFLAWENEFRRP